MLTSMSVTFAQTDGGSHQLKNRFQAKDELKVERAAVGFDQSVPASRMNVKSNFVNGIVRVKSGAPTIELVGGNNKRRMIPINLPKAMAKDGQELMFAYTVSEMPFAKDRKNLISIRLYDVSIPAPK